VPTTSRTETRSFSSIYTKLGNRLGQRLFADVSAATSLEPKTTTARLLAYVVAGAVHALTLGFATLGIWLVIAGWPDWLAVVVGALCLVVAWLVRPRPANLRGRVESRTDFPTLYDLMDRVAAALGAKPVRFLQVTSEFNAGFTRVGWRLRPAIQLGTPQLVSLDPQERVALIGHELGHSVNGNPAFVFFIGSAVHSLASWYSVLYPVPPRRATRRPGIAFFGRLAHVIAYPLALAVAQLPRLVAVGLIHLIWQDGQRAEYLADELAAKAGGTAAAVGMLQKSALSMSYHDIVQSASLNRRTGIFDEMRARTAAMSEGGWGEVPSLRGEEGGFRLDATHPPTGYRIRLLRSRIALRPEVLVSASDSVRIDAELAKVEQRIEREILDQHRAGLYR
jgi:Zn-dependent protease with chaperone function